MKNGGVGSWEEGGKSYDLKAHRIHGTGIFTYIYHKNQPNVGINIPYMDHMGGGLSNRNFLNIKLLECRCPCRPVP